MLISSSEFCNGGLRLREALFPNSMLDKLDGPGALCSRPPRRRWGCLATRHSTFIDWEGLHVLAKEARASCFCATSRK